MYIFSSSNEGFSGPTLRWERNFLYIFIAASGLFIVFPQIDIGVSQYFFQSGDFLIANHSLWLAIREFHRLITGYVLASMLILVVAYGSWRRPLPAIAPHKIVYILLTFVMGPGVVVQGLKLIIGRARPRHMAEFGGTFDFTPAWQLAGVCHRNCSFPSGEGSSAAAMLALFVLVPPRFRIQVAIFFIPYLVLVSLNRVFMGAHFLSDVVVAWTLVVGVMMWLWPRISRKADTIDSWVWLKGEKLRKWLYMQAD